MFKFNNKNILFLTSNKFDTFSNASNVDFEQANVCWAYIWTNN